MAYKPVSQNVTDNKTEEIPSSDAIFDFLGETTNKTLSNLNSPTAINVNLLFAKPTPSLEADHTQTAKENATLTIRAGNSIAGQRGNLNLHVCSNNTQYPLAPAGLTINSDAPTTTDVAADFDFSAGTGKFFKLRVDAGNVTNLASMWQGDSKFLQVNNNGTNVTNVQLFTNDKKSHQFSEGRLDIFKDFISQNIPQPGNISLVNTPDIISEFKLTRTDSVGAEYNLLRATDYLKQVNLWVDGGIQFNKYFGGSNGGIFSWVEGESSIGYKTQQRFGIANLTNAIAINYKNENGFSSASFATPGHLHIRIPAPGTLSVSEMIGHLGTPIPNNSTTVMGWFTNSNKGDYIRLSAANGLPALPTIAKIIAISDTLPMVYTVDRPIGDGVPRGIENVKPAILIVADDGSERFEVDYEGSLKLSAGLAIKSRHALTSSITVLSTDTYIGCNATAAVTVNLPKASEVTAGKMLIIKSENGASTVTITPFAGDTCDTASLSTAQVTRLISNGVSRWIAI